jgi:chemotaxis protein MotB
MSEESLDSQAKRPIILIRKNKKKHPEHHSGMWKVAYADFVTAMMAFFLLMWLVNTVSNDKLKGVAEYFTPVMGLKGQVGSGFEGGSDSDSKTKMLSARSNVDSATQGTPDGGPINESSDNKDAFTRSEEERLLSVMNNLEQNMDGTADIVRPNDNIMIEKSPEGIRIQIMDSINRSVFKSGSSQIQPYMTKFLEVIGNLVKNAPNYISIEGHTSEKSEKLEGIDQWNLSVERANAIRKFYEKRIKPNQVIRIVGKANTEPFDAKEVDSPRNSRVVIVLLNPDVVGKFQTAAPAP